MLQFPTFDAMNAKMPPTFRLRLGSTLCTVMFVVALQTALLRGQSDRDTNSTPTWQEAISAFESLANRHPKRASLAAFGVSDVGRPLHLFTMGPDDAPLRLLVNNAIHPGEPCGVNASIAWATDLLEGRSHLPDGIRIGIVPMYNVGGGLRRNCCTRANQEGPEEYGFRGNARNLDLNRDFIKCDSRNALSFNRMFADFNPDIFVDTHTSNGADYQPVLTLIATQPDKMGGPLGAWMENTFNPLLYSGMEQVGIPMIPYVNTIGDTPDGGIIDFLETPRYSTGYGTLHHAIGYTTEAHMLKPFNERVAATRAFLDVLLEAATENAGEVARLRALQHKAFLAADSAAVAWRLDTTAVDSLEFPGFEARYEWSNVTGARRLRYDRTAPYSRRIAHMHTFEPSRWAPIPGAYVIPQAWRHVIERLEANGVIAHPLERDTVLMLETATINAHEAAARPYEGHHYRTISNVSREMMAIQLFAGDLVVPLEQPAARYLVETLSPEAVDAFMAWNFFDSILQQKEYFSSYVFEETAQRMLEDNAELKAAFETAKMAASEAAPLSARAQLDWIYKRSPHFEGTPSRYPVYAIPKGQPLPIHE